MNWVALMIYGDANSGRNALTEEKYKDLAAALTSEGLAVQSVLYHDEAAIELAAELVKYEAILVWVNPIEQGRDRTKLDALLSELSNKGCIVSAHPEVILKMGTKDVLYKTKDMDWGGDVKMYKDHDDFIKRFPESLQKSKTRVVKQYRGNGGNGVFKITSRDKEVTVVHATEGTKARVLSIADFNDEFKKFFLNDGMLIDQEWNTHIVNGMVRCYLSGARVAGFGYQEINALYTINDKSYLPGKRYYYTENCGLFSDLKQIMENKWVPELQNKLSIDPSMLPIIWDADFFINEPNHQNTAEKYTLCEINVSSVSPFPPSAVRFMVEETKRKIAGTRTPHNNKSKLI